MFFLTLNYLVFACIGFVGVFVPTFILPRTSRVFCAIVLLFWDFLLLPRILFESKGYSFAGNGWLGCYPDSLLLFPA